MNRLARIAALALLAVIATCVEQRTPTSLSEPSIADLPATEKLVTGVSQTLLHVVRARATATTRGKVGGAMLRPALRGLRDEIHPEGPGGAYLLGLRKLGVVPHGRFSRVGFANAIRAAARGVEEDVTGRTIAAMESAGALRRPPSDSTATVAAE